MMFDIKKAVSLRNLPKYNEPTPHAFVGIKNQPKEYADLDYWIENTPEAIGILNALKTDILSGGVQFVGGRNKVKSAKKFWDDNLFFVELGNAMIDWLLYGDSYLWINKIDKAKLELATKRVLESKGLLKDGKFERVGIQLKQALGELGFSDEDTLKGVRHIPSTTMSIEHNQINVTGFSQVVNGQTITTFSPEEIIHFRFMLLKGKINGFSPMRASLPELQTIGYIKDYNKNFYKFGAVPSHIIALEDAMNNDPNLEVLKQQFQKYLHPSTNRGSLIVGGKVNVQKLENDEGITDQSWGLAVYATGVIAAGFSMPVERIMSISGKFIKTSTGSSDVSNEAYWRSIEVAKVYWESILNNQLWKPFFDCEMKLGRAFRQDEFREAQRDLMKADAIAKIKNVLKIPLSEQYVLSYFGISEEDLDESLRAKLEAQSSDNPQDRQQFAPNDRVIPGSANQRMREIRRAESTDKYEKNEK